jgi:hypothetical protein
MPHHDAGRDPREHQLRADEAFEIDADLLRVGEQIAVPPGRVAQQIEHADAERVLRGRICDLEKGPELRALLV